VFINHPRETKMGAGGQAEAEGWNEPGRKWRALINNGNKYRMVGRVLVA
jgi:hypothetical protein